MRSKRVLRACTDEKYDRNMVNLHAESPEQVIWWAKWSDRDRAKRQSVAA
ncbi:hypothetical protein [Xenorhabdus nematophila]